MDTLNISKIKGRGAVSNHSGRFERFTYEKSQDGWETSDPEREPVATSVYTDASKSVISYNDSPDIPFDRSVNPYRGCEHGCIYCYARPSHAWLGLSPGIDFETKLYAKLDAAALLRQELSRPSYRPAPLILGSNTDPYQPIEKKYQITRQILSVLLEFQHPVTIITKSALLLRDLDIFKELATHDLLRIFLSIGTLDATLARLMEPRAAQPRKRLFALQQLSAQQIPVGVLIAPIIPGLNDSELEQITQVIAESGATYAGYNLLRLPYEIKDLFQEWLSQHYPDRQSKILSLIRETRKGSLNNSDFSQRMTGQGIYAQLIGQRFRLAIERVGLNQKVLKQRTDFFRVPGPCQLPLI